MKIRFNTQGVRIHLDDAGKEVVGSAYRGNQPVRQGMVRFFFRDNNVDAIKGICEIAEIDFDQAMDSFNKSFA